MALINVCVTVPNEIYLRDKKDKIKKFSCKDCLYTNDCYHRKSICNNFNNSYMNIIKKITNLQVEEILKLL